MVRSPPIHLKAQNGNGIYYFTTTLGMQKNVSKNESFHRSAHSNVILLHLYEQNYDCLP